MSERVRGADLRVDDVIVKPHRGTMPPARITRVVPTFLGGVSISYTPDDGATKYGSYIEPDRSIEVERPV